MSRNDWEKSPNDRKEEAFHASDDNKKIRSKASKKPDKPFLLEYRYKAVGHTMFAFLLEWHGKRKFESLELANVFVKKLKREARSDRKEIRITDTRDGTIYAVD